MSTENPEYPASDVRNHLSAERLQQLRTAYDQPMLNAAAVTRASAQYAPAAAYVASIGEHFYMGAGQGGALSARDRELALIAMLAASGAPDFAFAVHVYWGLMEGLAVQDIAETILLAGSYHGIDTFVARTRLLASILDALTDEGPADSKAVLGRLMANFQ